MDLFNLTINNGNTLGDDKDKSWFEITKLKGRSSPLSTFNVSGLHMTAHTRIQSRPAAGRIDADERGERSDRDRGIERGERSDRDRGIERGERSDRGRGPLYPFAYLTAVAGSDPK